MTRTKSSIRNRFLEWISFILIIFGIVLCVAWVDWSQGTNLHPDEYGLTNTITQLSLPGSISEYFNTRISALSPYQKYGLDGSPTEPGPDNRMRWGQWPIILIRAAAELTGNTGYHELRLIGRSLSGLADIITLLLTFLIGTRLFDRKIALLGTAFSALAVMQIQQSHFMTVDNFGLMFAAACLYVLVTISQTPILQRNQIVSYSPYRILPSSWILFAAFGITFGMALSSRINLLPLGGILLVAVFIAVADLKLRRQKDLGQIVLLSIVLISVSALFTVLTFRATQPMSFRAVRGETTFFSFDLNPDWVDSMQVARDESRGIGGGPPSEQWANRPAIIFPWINMVLWGMGLPLGLTAWIGFFSSGWQVLRYGDNWRAHLIPLVWVGGYFLFMGTRFVKSMRYFLPIYPFLCLFAAWVLIDLYRRTRGGARMTSQRMKPVRLALIVLILSATLTWSLAFVNAVYRTDHTRIQASRWIYENIQPNEDYKPVIANENWDESLPLRIDGQDPYGGLYRGITMEVRWYDNEKKRQMFIETLAEADYLILPSQRAIWSVVRIPHTYPMTMEYYRALFDGRLGFDLAASFHSPIKIGPLQISDVGGTLAWGEAPSLPLFNTNPFAAEEAFSVYDHPPVWIFKKRGDFDIESVREILGAIDLDQVIVQSPTEAEW